MVVAAVAVVVAVVEVSPLKFVLTTDEVSPPSSTLSTHHSCYSGGKTVGSYFWTQWVH